VCGDGVHERATALLHEAGGVLAEFAALKAPTPVENEET
jgi:hypothetical protein